MQNNTIEEIIKIDLASVKKAQSLLNIAISNNHEKFVKSIKNNDLASLNESLQWGIAWNSSNFWDVLGRKFSFKSISYEMLDKISKLDIPSIEINNHSLYNHDSVNKNAKEYGKSLFKRFLQQSLSDIFFNPELFMWIIKNQPSLMAEDTLKKQLTKFISHDVSQPQYNVIHDYIQSNHPSLVFDIVGKYSNTTNFNFFKNDERYKNIFNIAIKQENVSSKMMFDAIANGDLAMIKILQDHNINLSSSKETYSNLFGNKNIRNSSDVVDYMILNTNPIGIHNHIILRTCLRQNRKDLIEKVIFNYFTSNRLYEVETHFKDREENEALKIAKERTEYLKFCENLSETLVNENKSHKFKI